MHHKEEIRPGFPSSEIQRLQEQNISLRNAIAQMRKEMEMLSDQILPSAYLGGKTSDTNQPDPNAAADTATPGACVRERDRDGERERHRETEGERGTERDRERKEGGKRRSLLGCT